MNGADDDPRDVDCGLNPAFDLPAPYSKLTPLEINTLVRISQFMSIKEIASADGVGAEAIIARINRARYKLDGMPRVKAAREVARLVQNSPSYNPVYMVSTLSEPPIDAPPAVVESEQSATGSWLPFPTTGRRKNDDSTLARLLWPFAIAAFTLVMMALLQAIMTGIENFR